MARGGGGKRGRGKTRRGKGRGRAVPVSQEEASKPMPEESTGERITILVMPRVEPVVEVVPQEPVEVQLAVVRSSEAPRQTEAVSTQSSSQVDESTAVVRRSSRIQTLETRRGGQRRREVVFAAGDALSKNLSSITISEDDSSSNSSNNVQQAFSIDISTGISISPPRDPSPTNSPATSPLKLKSRWKCSSDADALADQSTLDATIDSVVLTTLEASELFRIDDTSSANLIKKPGHIFYHQEDNELPEKLLKFQGIDENIFKSASRTINKESRGLLCDCYLSKEEISRGEIGCNENCLNRLLMVECESRCPTGDRCTNKKFQRREYCQLQVFKTDKKGHGLRTRQNLPTGGFVIEYVGEVLDPREFGRRTKEYAKENQEHFYFMALKSDSIIDATQKGNCSRFINHSCEPNCETQKWTVGGELRIGFFAIKDLVPGDEITFDYQFQRYGKEAQKCYCLTATCRGWIGADDDEGIDVKEEDEENDAEVEEAEATVVRPKVKRKYVRKPKKLEQLEDKAFDEELSKLASTGLRNKNQTLSLSRLMVRAEKWEARERILNILINGDTPCRRLFLDYHGLRLIWGWMLVLPEPSAEDDNSAECDNQRKLFLKALLSLPIPNRTMLQDSKVLAVIEKWSQIPPATRVIKSEPVPVNDSDLIQESSSDSCAAEVASESTDAKAPNVTVEKKVATDTAEQNACSVAADPTVSSDPAEPKVSGDSAEPKVSSDSVVPKVSSDPAEPKVSGATKPAEYDSCTDCTFELGSSTEPTSGNVTAFTDCESTPPDSASQSESDPIAVDVPSDPTSLLQANTSSDSFPVSDTTPIDTVADETAQKTETELEAEPMQVDESMPTTTIKIENEDEAFNAASAIEDCKAVAVAAHEEVITEEVTWDFVNGSKELLASWSGLQEVFRIPKKERVEQMKEHEREADKSDRQSIDSDRDRNLFDRGPARFRGIRTDGRRTSAGSDRDHYRDRPRDFHRNRPSLPSSEDYPNMSKEQRRNLFAAKVAAKEAEDRQKRMIDEMVVLHQHRCTSLGLDSAITPIVDPTCSYFLDPGNLLDPNTINWKQINLEDPNLHPGICIIVQAFHQSLFQPQFTPESQPEEPTEEELFPPWPQGLPPPPPLPPRTLPKYWRMNVDDEGRCYYYDIRTRQTQWTLPSPEISEPTESEESEEAEDDNGAVTTSGDEGKDQGEEEEGNGAVVAQKFQCWMSSRAERRKRTGLVSERMISPRNEEEKSTSFMSQAEIHDNKVQLAEEKKRMAAGETMDTSEPTAMVSLENELKTEPNASNVLQCEQNQDGVSTNPPERVPGEEQEIPDIGHLGLNESEDQEPADAHDGIPGLEPSETSLSNDLLTCKPPPAVSRDEKKRSKKSRHTKHPVQAVAGGSKERSDDRKTKAANIEAFRSSIANVIVQHLNPYRKPNCTNAHISTTEDFKHLARKMTHAIALKEMKHSKDGKTIVVNDSVKHKTKEYVRKYMARFQGNYSRSPEDSQM